MNLPNQIETKRLILRLFNQDDFEVFSNIIEDDVISNNLKFVLKIKPEKNKTSFFRSIIDSYSSKHPIIALIVSTKQEGNNIGFCGLIPLENGSEAETFYTVFPKYRGYGYAIETMKKLIEFAFKGLNLTRIITFLHPTNTKAWKVAERIGMKYLGHKQINDISSKAMYFSLEKTEFEAQSDY
ncbi:MAG: GNAT family N-acetyltransferase [Candidatus Lokiarchaeota archaeon]|nr:GNAT family N-acetyltransferase [Candidatus Lokiarchaeota archaeon]